MYLLKTYSKLFKIITNVYIVIEDPTAAAVIFEDEEVPILCKTKALNNRYLNVQKRKKSNLKKEFEMQYLILQARISLMPYVAISSMSMWKWVYFEGK